MKTFRLVVLNTLVLCVFGTKFLTLRKDFNETINHSGETQIRHLDLPSTINNEYCNLGGHMEYLTFHCPSEKLSYLKNVVGDTDEPPHTQLCAMVVSSIAVGCKNTAQFFIKQLLELDSSDRMDRGFCNASVSNAPSENISTPCDMKLADYIRDLVQVDGTFKILFDTLAPPIFLSLGCGELGRKYFDFLKKDLDINSTTNISVSLQKNSKDFYANHSKFDKGTSIMRYINTHKIDMEKMRLADDFGGVLSVDSNDTVENGRRRRKRSAAGQNIDTYFKRKENCSIALPLGVTVQTSSKTECLQLCLDEDSCQSVGYTKDESEICQLNTETEKEAGPLFRCMSEESSYWEYFEKKKDISYFIITWKTDGRVLEATSDTSVNIGSFKGDDNQFWFWEEDAIRSKKYSSKVLGVNHKDGHVNLGSYHGETKQRWNYENEGITSQYNSFNLSIKKSNSVTYVGVSENTSEKWSLSLDRFYFIITNRQSGKVLDVADCTKGRVGMWSYHGGDNQLWFWDDENIRSKECPEKVLDLHMHDYNLFNWGKVYLHPFNGGENQKWKIENDNIISRFKNLSLDVKNGNKANGAIVGGNIDNSKTNQKWTLGTLRTYFFILNKQTGKVMDASSPAKIVQRHFYRGDNQLWFWDDDVIRNKKYTDKVIGIHISDYARTGWGKLYLDAFHGRSNQRWIYKDQYLISMYQNLSTEVSKASLSDNSMIGVQESKTQKWSFNPEHDFFTITSRLNAKVLDASSDKEVVMWSYHGQDHQLWFWDDHSIRSKYYPHKVLDLNCDYYNKYNWGKVYLHPYNGEDTQKWQLKGDSIISDYKQLYLGIRYSSAQDGAKVGGYRRSKNLNQMWSFNSKERVYFIIKGQQSGKVLDVQSNLNILIWSYNGGDHQLWFWDKDSIRSKKYPDKVLDLHMDDYKRNNWGKIYMHSYNGGENQKWSIEGDYIVSGFRHLVIDVYAEKTHNGAKVGGYRRGKCNNQKWEISVSHGKKTSCVDKTEEGIYNVIQWIPLISTLWDLFSSIGYAASGCTSIANERGISFAIGTVMDVATIATGGAASAATSVIKTGVKAGIQFGLKQGMKSAVRFAKQSIQNVVRNTLKQIGSRGLLSTLKSGIKKAGKLVVRETIVDPANFLKNTGKISKKILTHPKRTLKQTWKAASKNIDNLKQLKSKYRSLKNSKTRSFEKFGPVGKTRCKRGGLLSCVRPDVDKGYSKAQEKMYHELLKEQTNSPTLETCAQRYMTMNGNSFDSAPQFVRTMMDGMTTEVDKAELFAMYKYTVNPDMNLDVQSILDKKPILSKKMISEKYPKMSKKEVNTYWERMKSDMNSPSKLELIDKHLYEATLVQSYLKRNPLESPQTVFRYEDIKFTGRHYKNNKVYTSNRFMSTTKRPDRFTDSGLDLTNTAKYNTELTIHLKKSGSDISTFSAHSNQEEILIPINTKFKVKRFKRDKNGITKIVLTELD